MAQFQNSHMKLIILIHFLTAILPSLYKVCYELSLKKPEAYIQLNLEDFEFYFDFI